MKNFRLSFCIKWSKWDLIWCNPYTFKLKKFLALLFMGDKPLRALFLLKKSFTTQNRIILTINILIVFCINWKIFLFDEYFKSICNHLKTFNLSLRKPHMQPVNGFRTNTFVNYRIDFEKIEQTRINKLYTLRLTFIVRKIFLLLKKLCLLLFYTM